MQRNPRRRQPCIAWGSWTTSRQPLGRFACLQRHRGVIVSAEAVADDETTYSVVLRFPTRGDELVIQDVKVQTGEPSPRPGCTISALYDPTRNKYHDDTENLETMLRANRLGQVVVGSVLTQSAMAWLVYYHRRKKAEPVMSINRCLPLDRTVVPTPGSSSGVEDA